MAIHTRQSLTGFLTSDPQLTFTSQGDARLYARIGQENYRRNDDGTFTQLETTFHDLVVYRRSAERAHAAFAKGDRFVAEGHIRTYEHQVDGQTRQGEEFIATKLGHDTARTTYTVDRSHRPAAAAQSAVGAAGNDVSASALTPTPKSASVSL